MLDPLPSAGATVPVVEPVEMIAAKVRRHRDIPVCSIGDDQQTRALLLSDGFGRQRAHATGFLSGRN